MDIFAIETEMHRRHIYGLLDSLNNSIFAYDELNKKAVDILTKLKSGEITIDDIDVSPPRDSILSHLRPSPQGCLTPVPTGVENWEFSYSRSKGQMRWKLGADEWVCDRIVGNQACQILAADGRTGRWILRCQLQIQNEIAYIYRDPDALEHPAVLGYRLPASFWRMCYRREEGDFRLKNELTNDPVIFVKSYVGDLHLSWRDSGPHVFHTGYWIIDEHGVAHAYK